MQQLAVTTVGGVVMAAQPLLTIVPENTHLELEAQVLNRDIGHVRLGQRVINKVETYDFTPFGGAAEVMKELRETVFAGKAVHQLMPDAQGHAKTLTWPAVGNLH